MQLKNLQMFIKLKDLSIAVKIKVNDFSCLLTMLLMFQWMVRRWAKYLGEEEAIGLMKWNNSDPSFSLRFLDISFPFSLSL